MEYLLGGLVVLTVLAFVILPLVRTRPAQLTTPSESSLDRAQQRAAIYRELLELELDQQVGKLAEADFREMNDALLARAAALIVQEDAASTTVDAEIEREIAEAREALRRAESAPAGPTPVEETRA